MYFFRYMSEVISHNQADRHDRQDDPTMTNSIG